MQTNLADFIKDSHAGQEADEILRKCVHCGFCTATCPTYQLLGDELDGPRGRIYLIKQVLEGQAATEKTQQHLDRCLTCRNCESTCPSGVKYSRLLDIGRAVVEQQVGRSVTQSLLRKSLSAALPRPWIFRPAMQAGQFLRPVLPQFLKNKIPLRKAAQPVSPLSVMVQPGSRMLLLDGCVQPTMAPEINAAARRVMAALGTELIVAPKAGCCGAIRHHLNEQEAALQDMRRNIDAWWPAIEAGVDAILMTASGCGVTVKEYGHLLAHDAAYAEKAARVTALCKDLSEVLAEREPQIRALVKLPVGKKIVWHPPCTLQHGQQIRGKVESLLRAVGVDVSLCADSHLCCGSAGTYSVLQPRLAYQLRDQKLKQLLASQPVAVVSANIGCITHLQSGTDTPVQHWIEWIDQALSASA